MRYAIWRLMSVLCVVGLVSTTVEARDSVLTAIPADTLSFTVVHNLADTSHSIGEIAKLVQAPAPDLLTMGKAMYGLDKGIDAQGDLAVVVMSIDPAPKVVVLVPVSNFADFFAALHVQDPGNGSVEAQLGGKPKLVGRRGNFAAIGATIDREAFEAFLAANGNLAADASLGTWIDANKVSAIVTARGLAQFLPKLANGIRTAQAAALQSPNPQAKQMADGLGVYLTLFTAAEPELDQFALGLRIDSAQTLDIVKRAQFKPGGAWAKWAADVKPATEQMLAGLPNWPFIAAGGTVVPAGAIDHLMKLSVQMMQGNPAFNLTPEQAAKFVQITSSGMRDVRAMRMIFGVAEPGAGLYSNTSAILAVDNAATYLANYEKTLAAMHDFSQEVKSPFVSSPTVTRSKLGDVEVLEVTMDLPDPQANATPGASDPQQLMRMFAGPGGKMQVFIAPADEHNVVMAYTSIDQLKSALAAFKSNQPGISADPGIAKVTAALPPGSQLVAYVSMSGFTKLMQQMMAAVPTPVPIRIPDFAPSPPLGMAAKVTPAGVEGHLVVTADTLRAIGDTVAKFRQGMGRPAGPPQ